MFGDMFGKMEERQKALKEKLKDIEVETHAGGGAILVRANANRTLTKIEIDRDKIDFDDEEQLAEILMVAVNDVLDKAEVKERDESKKMLQDLLPPGMGGLSNLFS